MARAHLVRRFGSNLVPLGASAADVRWVAEVLRPGELKVWAAQRRQDRRHSVRTARRLDRALAGTPFADDPTWTAVALLHDVGKQVAGLGTYGRVAASLASRFAGRDMAVAWVEQRGMTRRIGLHLQYGRLGADLIELHDGRPEAAAWAVHHHEPAAWDALGFPPEVVAALVAADE
jgi:hypothetical protein